MPTAFVLINTEIGSEADVLKELKKVEGVEEASAVYGVYDIVARVKADTMDKLKEIVTWRIRRLDKVRSTLTMIVPFFSFNPYFPRMIPVWSADSILPVLSTMTALSPSPSKATPKSQECFLTASTRTERFFGFGSDGRCENVGSGSQKIGTVVNPRTENTSGAERVVLAPPQSRATFNFFL